MSRSTVSRYHRRPPAISRGTYVGYRLAQQVVRRLVESTAKRARSGAQQYRSAKKPKRMSKSLMPYSKIRKGQYNTVGRIGRSFPKPKSKKAGTSQFFRSGYVRYTESGGVVESTDCIYVGHSFAHVQLLYSVLSAMLRRLFAKMGVKIQSWTDKLQGIGNTTFINSPGDIHWTYKTDTGAPITRATYAIAADATFEQIAESLRTSVQTVFATNVAQCTMHSLEFTGRDVGSVNTYPNAVLTLGNIELEFDCSSSMALQNRTQAKSDVADPTRFDSSDVANNPIAGKVYGGPGNGTGPRSGDNASATSPMIASELTGSFAWDPQQAAVTPDMRAVYRRPPAKQSLLYVNRVSNVLLMPGQIRNSLIIWRRKMKLSQYLLAIQNQLESGVNDVRIPLGKFECFAFEKKCNTRVDEPAISIGYELNQVYRVNVHEKQSGIAAHVVLV